MSITNKRNALIEQLDVISTDPQITSYARGLARHNFYILTDYRKNKTYGAEISAFEASSFFEDTVKWDPSSFPIALIKSLDDLRDLVRSYAGLILEGHIDDTSKKGTPNTLTTSNTP